MKSLCTFETSGSAHPKTVAYRGEFEGSTPPKFRRPSKIVPNSTRLWKLLKIAGFKTPTHQDVRKKVSKILKLPSVHNCFTLAITNKLVVIINSLKVPKTKKILLYEIKFLVPNYSCLQNPWLGATAPRSPLSLSSVLSWICWTPPPAEKILGTPLPKDIASHLSKPLNISELSLPNTKYDMVFGCQLLTGCTVHCWQNTIRHQ